MRKIVLDRITRALNARGYEVKPDFKPLRRPPAFFDFAKERGFAPRTLIDVGVGEGTPWLYEAFPRAYLALIEPNEYFKPWIERILNRRRGVARWAAASSAKGEGVLHVRADYPTSSSIAPPNDWLKASLAQAAIEARIEEKPIRLEKLDDLLADLEIDGPMLLKIDAEGHELSVLEGAMRTLREVEMIIAETSVRPRFENGYVFADMIAKMENLGFALFDIVDMGDIGRNGPLSFIDAVFLSKESLLWKAV